MEERQSMLVFTVAQTVCERLGSFLPHVEHQITCFLLRDLYAIPLENVVHHNHLPLLKYLLLDPKCPHGGFSARNFDQNVTRAIKKAIVENKMDFLELLVTQGPALFENGLTSSSITNCAAGHGNLQALEWLVSNRHASCYPRALEAAVKHGHLDVLKFLMERIGGGPSRSSPRGCLLECVAAQHGHQEIVQYLLTKCSSADLNFRVDAVRRQARDHQQFRLLGWLDKTYGSKGPRLVDVLQGIPIDEKLIKCIDAEELKWMAHHLPDFQLDPNLLVAACEPGDTTKCQWLLDRLKLPKHHQVLEASLSVACDEGHVEVAKLLLHHGATADSLTLDQAVSNGHFAMVQFLRQEFNVTEFQDVDESVAAAAVKGHVEMVRLFDPQIRKQHPPEAFWNAAGTGNLAMLEFLLSKPHDVSVYRETMTHAFEGGQVQVAKHLLNHITNQGLTDSLRHDLVHVRQDFKAFVEKGSGIKREHLIGLHMLLCQEPRSSLAGEDFGRVLSVVLETSDYVPLVEMLHSCKVRGFHDFMICTAARKGFFKTVCFLFEHHSKSRASDALVAASMKGYFHIVKYLLQNGAKASKSAFEKAPANGCWRIVQLLYENQPIPNDTVARVVRDAAKEGHVEVVKYLLSVHESRNGMDIQEAFRRACCGGNVRLAQWLMEHEAANVKVAAALKAARSVLDTKFNLLDIERLISVLEDPLSG